MYSKEDKEAFRLKDERIAKQALLKSLIEKCDIQDVYDVTLICELADKYLQYVNGVSGNVVATKDSVDWESTAEGLNIVVPNAENIKILDLIVSEYKNQTGDNNIIPANVLTHILKYFGRYPAKQESVSKVVSSLVSQ